MENTHYNRNANGGGDINGISNEETHLMQLIASHPQNYHTMENTESLFQAMESITLQPFHVHHQAQASVSYDANQLHMATMASSFLSSLVGEFGGSNTAAAYNCSLEFHRLAHVAFEEKGILDLLKISINGLSGAVTKLSSDPSLVDASCGVVNLTIDVLSWEFGSLGGKWGRTGSSALVRPPESWREYLIRPDFLGAVFQVYTSIRNEAGAAVGKLKHSLRQLLILLSSITGIVFLDKNQKNAYCGFMIDGCMSVLSLLITELNDSNRTMEQMEYLESETVDLCSMITRLVTNFRIGTLCVLPTFSNLLTAIATVGDALLKISVLELKNAQGDMEMVDGGEWRDEALGMLLEAVCLLAEDPWLFNVRQGNAQDAATILLKSNLAPLYHSYVTSRIEMAKMEEHYLTANAADLDEVREEISGTSLEEEMTTASSLGRVNLVSSLSCLSSLFQTCLPRLQGLFATEGHDVTPEAAALLEEGRLLIICACHLLTDDTCGETPLIPENILNACGKPSTGVNQIKSGAEDYVSTSNVIKQIVTSLMGLAEFQASRIAANPNNPNLSPLLAKTLLWFFARWAPAYIIPSSNEYDSRRLESGNDGILAAWSDQDSSQQAVSFCITLCLHYLCYWPQETQVQEGGSELLLGLARRGRQVRILLMQSPSMEHLVNLHSNTAAMIHTSSQAATACAGLNPAMINGFKRIPYKYRAQILRTIVIASSEINDAKSEQYLNASLQATQNAFSSLVQALEAKTVRVDDIASIEMVCLCVELFGGVAQSSEMCHPERIPIFLTQCLPRLSALMVHYASNITICEILLRLFRDYTEQFIVMLDRDQCLVAFKSSAELLKSYSANHCSSRVIRSSVDKSAEAGSEEEQSYNDVLCAIQLLNNIGAKDFIDSFSSERTGKGVESKEVIEVVFYGLQQILPLMTQGLLHFPRLCKQYYSLVGFMMDTYPEKVGALPFDLFRGLLDSLLFGMSHTDSFVSKSSLQGISSLAREHIESSSFNNHLSHDGSLFDDCALRLLKEVVFETIIWDRLEPSATALLPLAAIDLNKFAGVVNTITQHLDAQKQKIMQSAFQRLMQPDVMSKVANGNYGGRMNRMRFKRDFEIFVKDIHSAVLIF